MYGPQYSGDFFVWSNPKQMNGYHNWKMQNTHNTNPNAPITAAAIHHRCAKVFLSLSVSSSRTEILFRLRFGDHCHRRPNRTEETPRYKQETNTEGHKHFYIRVPIWTFKQAILHSSTSHGNLGIPFMCGINRNFGIPFMYGINRNFGIPFINRIYCERMSKYTRILTVSSPLV